MLVATTNFPPHPPHPVLLFSERRLLSFYLIYHFEMGKTLHRILRTYTSVSSERRILRMYLGLFPGGSVSKESACSAGDLGSIPGSRRSPGEGNGNQLQYSCLKNPVGKRAWQPIVHGVSRVRPDLVTKPPPQILKQLTAAKMQ